MAHILRRSSILAKGVALAAAVSASSAMSSSAPTAESMFRPFKFIPLSAYSYCDGETAAPSAPVAASSESHHHEGHSHEHSAKTESAPKPEPPKKVEPIVVEDAGDDEEWESEKRKCSFCRFFLNSPCRHEFKYWSKCVDKAKQLDVDFAQACHVYTSKLLDCTSQNEAYFEEERDKPVEEDDSSAASATSTTPVDANNSSSNNNSDASVQSHGQQEAVTHTEEVKDKAEKTI